MIYLLVSWLILAVAIFITARILPGLKIESFGRALVVAIVLALLNVCLRPLLAFVFAPLTWITFGLFSLVINGLVLWATSGLVSGFKVQGCWWAILGALVISLFRTLLFSLIY